MKKKSLIKPLFLIFFLTIVAAFIALPDKIGNFNKPVVDFYFLGKHVYKNYQLRKGLDIQGGMQVTLQAEMDNIAAEDKLTALESAREVIAKRVDLYGISEASIQTSQKDGQYRLIIELPGVSNPKEALDLVGSTAQLEFKLQKKLTDQQAAEATVSAQAWLNTFTDTGLTGKQLKRSQAQLDPQTAKPIISLEMNAEGRDLFANVTKNNVNEVLAIFIDGVPIMTPVISTAILDGRAVISGSFTIEEAKNLAIQLNAGALPVNIKVLEQKTIGASLGDESIQKSVTAGLVGLSLVLLFMIIYYG